MKSHLTTEEIITLYRSFFVFGDASTLKILYELERYGKKNFTELKKELGINPATLTKKLKILQDIGLIEADRSQDKLRVYYSIIHLKRPVKRLLDAVERISTEL